MKHFGESTIHPPSKRRPSLALLSCQKKLPIPMEINAEIKHQIFKLLEGVSRSPEMWKKKFIHAIKETARFKSQDLIRHLENTLEKLESDHFLNKDNHTSNLII
ncbi:unnamed protein product [Nyctereutes procyonoides]|uniref:(raccoon dog) hypothetical protein n=1 Tax=Nyctereutes procyonoides TaxID=34880 RepID=A0A811ZH02_NYCPR|nr:unnamed protein product [Nyctereutes procyonoides]